MKRGLIFSRAHARTLQILRQNHTASVLSTHPDFLYDPDFGIREPIDVRGAAD